jgi:Cytochrome P460
MFRCILCAAHGATVARSYSDLSGASQIIAVLLALAGSLAFAAQDRYTLKIPDGLAWSEFRGCETWQNVAVSQTETSLKVIAANDAMINAYRDGVPDNGKLFPDGSKITKIEWSFKRNALSPYFVTVPGTVKTVAFIEKDTKRFPNTHGWAYAQWAYDAGTDTFNPSELSPSGAECGFACHTTCRRTTTFSRRIQKGERAVIGDRPRCRGRTLCLVWLAWTFFAPCCDDTDWERANSAATHCMLS